MAELTFLDKLNRLLSISNGRQRNVAETLGIESSYVSQLLNSKRKPSRQLEILLDSKLAELSKLPPSDKFSPVAILPSKRRVPVVSWALAGAAEGGVGHFEDLATQIEEEVETESRDPNAFAIRIEGDSMEPTVLHGDAVVFEPNRLPRNGQICLAKLKNEKVYLKRFYRTGPEGEAIKLKSENPNYKPIEVKVTDIIFVYPAANLNRKLQ
jgi:SOS-response transcriptional repressor LexA